MNTVYAIYECNNGYNCSCCRREWTLVEDKDFQEGTLEEDIIAHFKAMGSDTMILEKIIFSIKTIDLK
jgi:hypothetical protein